jgi:hypothetical protein
MARTKQVSQRESYLSEMIEGYGGYSSSEAAYRTDQVFSEEVLSRLSETMAVVKRIERVGSECLDPDALATLYTVAESVDSLAKCLSDTVPVTAAVLDALENRRVEEIIDLDSEILDKLGNINQALSMMDLEGGVGISPDELESVIELLDDLGDSLRQRVILLEG